MISRPLQPAIDPQPLSKAWLFGLLIFILLLHIPFLLIHHVQEDAYITFRTARHLAEHGDYSFNLHEHYPGTTSLLYVWIVAGIDLVLHSHMVQGVQLFGMLCVAVGSYFAVRGFISSRRDMVAGWLLLALWPVSLVVSYTGMETPLLLLALGVALYSLHTGRNTAVFFLSVFSLPLIRPDAVAYGVLLCLAMLLIEVSSGIVAGVSLCLGGLTLLLLNKWTTGVFLPGTIKAKLIAYHPSHGAAATAQRAYDLFLHQSFLLPVSTTYLTKAAPLLLGVVIACFVFMFRTLRNRRSQVVLGVIAAMVITIPAFYAVGGVIFDWYLYPSNWLAFIIVVMTIVHLAHRSAHPRLVWICVGGLWVMLGCVQWSRSLTASTQDFHYRADIGRYLQQVSHGSGRLYLEPAGYIPYFSGLATDDEVGLVSGRVLQFMESYPGSWWIHYVEAEQPTYIVQRETFIHFETFEGETLSAAEQQWFQLHYHLLRRTHYEPTRYHDSKVAAWILKHGAMPDYLVYERNQPEAGTGSKDHR